MSLKIGDLAPDFALLSKNQTGEAKEFKLSAHKGKNIVLLFFPQAFTAPCTEEMCTISGGFNEYANLNADIWGISVDSVFSQEGWAKQKGITIPLLSDFNKVVIGPYGTRYPDGAFPFGMNGVSKRAAFVVDKEGKLQHIEILEDAGKLPDFNAIKECLKKLG